MSLTLPEDLITLGKWCNGSPEVSKDYCYQLYVSLQNSLKQALKKSMSTHGFSESQSDWKLEEQVSFYLFGGNSEETKTKYPGLLYLPLKQLEAKTSMNDLVHDFKKLAARLNNPAGYELSRILYRNIRVLENMHEVVREAASAGKYLSSWTQLKLASAPDRKASFEDYQENAGKVGYYETKTRGGSYEKSQIVTPKDAQKLIKELLGAFNGWIALGTLNNAFFKHVPQQLRLVSMGELTSDGDNADEGLEYEPAVEDGGNEYIKELYEAQYHEILSDRTTSIWEQVCAVTQGGEIFCLLTIPSIYTEYHTEATPKKTLSDFGGTSTSTIGDRANKIEEIFRNEVRPMKAELGNIGYTPEAEATIQAILDGILIKLHHRCTEIRCNPHLSITGDGKELD